MHVSEDELQRYLAGGVSENYTDQLEAHLDECGTCRMRLAKCHMCKRRMVFMPDFTLRIASSADAAAQSLLSLLNDILDLSKIEAGRLELIPVAFSLRQCMEDAVRIFAVAAQQKGLDLRLQVEPDVPDVLVGDPFRLRQIVVNLLGNAIKFTARGGVGIRVELERQVDSKITLHFRMSDTGVGIAGEQQAEIFEPFRQADGSTTRQYGGTGLGLAICTRLVELMGGHIWLESRVGEGSVFHFTAPFVRSAVGTAGGPSDSEDLSQLASTLSSVEPSQGRPLRILLAEDNIVNQKLIMNALLKREGHAVTVATNGCEVLAATERQAFDLILMDVQMPEMDGFEATAAIREAERGSGRHVPIVAMTAHAMKGDRDKCIQAGMDDYLSKPLKLEALRSTLGKWTKRELRVAPSILA